jgi:hypothetical protein
MEKDMGNTLAAERQRDIMSEAVSKMGRDTPLAQKARSVANAMFLTARNTHLPDGEMLTSLAMLSGMACGILTDCAEALDGDDEA